MKSLICFAGAAAIAATLVASGPAAAGPIVIPMPGNPKMVQTTVKLGDLDLGRPAGAQTAVGRIRRAAQAVCGEDLRQSYPLALSRGWKKCAKNSMQDAVARVDHPLVTRAAYGEKAAPAEYAAR